MTAAYTFLCGASVALAVVIALFFLRYYRRTGDRFFVMFAIAFVLMAVQWGAAAAQLDMGERHPEVYLLRLAAFVLIVAAILDKNRVSPSRSRRPSSSRERAGEAATLGSRTAGGSRTARVRGIDSGRGRAT